MSEISVSIVDRPGIRTAGMKVRSTMATAMQDCPKIWSDDFGPRMEMFPADPAYPGQSFGVSVMIDENSFDYWAVMPLAVGVSVPDGMEEFEIPGGFYACSENVTLAGLGDVFNYLYMKWPTTQSDYVLDYSRPSLEAYRNDFCQTQLLTVLCPVKKA